MSERRRLRAGATAAESVVPETLRRFWVREWLLDEDQAEADAVARMLQARRRWDTARRQWAQDHGFDLAAKYGAAPGRDWWAFLELCRSGGR